MAAAICCLWSTEAPADPRGNRLPPRSCNLGIEAPVDHWYEGIPLGNGQLGALIWGQHNQLVVKLDRLDIWDERCIPLFKTPEFTWKRIQEYREAGNFKRIHEVFEKHYRTTQEPPTHIAMGKVLLTLPKELEATTFELDLARAEARVQFQHGAEAKAIASATEPVIIMQVPGQPEQWDMWAPGTNPPWYGSLGYGYPVMGRDQSSRWYEQSIPEGITYGYNGVDKIPAWKFVVFAKARSVGNGTLIAMTVTSSQKDGRDPLAAARAWADKALDLGYEKLLRAHRKFWTGFWSTSAIELPDPSILQQYYMTRYFLGSSSRPGFPAMAALQSIWTDDKMIPYFKNNLLNDLETEVQYQSYQTAGNFTEGRAFLEHLYNLLPTFRGFAKSFYGTSGAAVPGIMTYGGNPTTGWAQYSMSPTQAGWFGWLFYQHWRYTRDRQFLETRAYPWCAEIAENWRQLLKPDAERVLKLPLSSSAEIFENTPRAWLKPNSNQDGDLMQAHLLGLTEMARALGKTSDAERWSMMANALGPRHVDEENALMWCEDEKVVQSHRHFSQTYSVWPFNLITVEGSDRDRQIIAGTMRRLDRLGHSAWAGWSWPWVASLCARVGDSESAYKDLDLFVKGWITRNGFHMNADLHGVVRKKITKSEADMLADPFQRDLAEWAIAPELFTIEGNMLANQAVHDMLIQSWAPSMGKGEPGIVRLFPATPWNWHNASFEDLRAEGGFRVSAKRVNNATVWFRITAETDGLLRLRDNFDGRLPKWSGAKMSKVGNGFEKQMRKGDTVEATFDAPVRLPAKPIDTYTPVGRAPGTCGR